MHFGKQLKLVMYQPWKDGYLDWKRLKNIIREIEAATNERAALIEEARNNQSIVIVPPNDGVTPNYGSINGSPTNSHSSLDSPIPVPVSPFSSPSPTPSSMTALSPVHTARFPVPSTTTTTTTTSSSSLSGGIAMSSRDVDDMSSPVYVPGRRSIDEERESLMGRGILPGRGSDSSGRSLQMMGEGIGDSNGSIRTSQSPMLSATSLKRLSMTMDGVRNKKRKANIHADLATQEEIDYFINELENERVRVEAFFLAQMQFARAKMEAAAHMIKSLETTSIFTSTATVQDSTILLPIHEDKVVLKKALFDAMFTCEELVDFSRLNLVGFAKLVAKLVKYTNYSNAEDMLERIAQSAFVFSLPDNDLLKDEIKNTWMNAFHHEEYQRYLAYMHGSSASPSVSPSPSPSLGSSGSGSSRRMKFRSRKKEEIPTLPVDTELEDSVHAARAWKRNTILAEFDDHQRRAAVRSSKKVAAKKSIWPYFIAIAVVFCCQFFVFFPVEHLPAQHCLGILVAATILWVTEVCPLFLTALMIPLGVILCEVLVDHDAMASSGSFDFYLPANFGSSSSYSSSSAQMPPILPASLAAKAVFQQLFPSNIPLILAGFAIAQAFSKYGLDIAIVQFVLRFDYWRTPNRFLIALEFMCFVMSMFISNVAASVLMMTIAMPVIRDLPKHSVYAKSILLAIAVSGNVGGMTTLIASPQNSVVAGLGDYAIDFIHFSMISLPLCPILLTAGHFLVVSLFRPDIKQLPKLSFADDAEGANNGITDANIELASDIIAEAKRSPEYLAGVPFYRRRLFQQVCVSLITLISIGLWASSPWLDFFGDCIGVISLIPLGLFFGCRFLGKEEFEKMPWSLVILIAGGNVLGYAVEESHLLELASKLLLAIPLNLWVICAVSGLIMMVAGSFVSHTVAALILLRLFAKVGDALNHAKLMVMTSIIMCSGSMPLPISSFPNLNTFSVEDSEGVQYLSTLDFIKVGIPCTLLGYFGSVSIIYGLSLFFKL